MEGDDGSDWLLYGRNYNAWRFSPLTWINKENVGNLELAWMMETGLHDAFECSPIVVDGVMYVSTPGTTCSPSMPQWVHSTGISPTGCLLT